MARSWCGFVPQNQSTKEQWGLLEATRPEMDELIGCVESGEVSEAAEQLEELEARLPEVHKPR